VNAGRFSCAYGGPSERGSNTHEVNATGGASGEQLTRSNF